MAQAIKTPEGWLGEIKEWQIVQANSITFGIGDIAVIGKVLIGPHEIGAQTFIPPGIWSNTPEGFKDDVTDKGWRHGVYKRLGDQAIKELDEQNTYPVNGDESNLVWVTKMERPVRSENMSLKEADELIAEETGSAPDFVDFAKEVTAVKAKQLQIKNSLEDNEIDQTEKIKARNELTDLLSQASAAFGPSWLNQQINSAHLIN